MYCSNPLSYTIQVMLMHNKHKREQLFGTMMFVFLCRAGLTTPAPAVVVVMLSNEVEKIFLLCLLFNS